MWQTSAPAPQQLPSHNAILPSPPPDRSMQPLQRPFWPTQTPSAAAASSSPYDGNASSSHCKLLSLRRGCLEQPLQAPLPPIGMPQAATATTLPANRHPQKQPLQRPPRLTGMPRAAATSSSRADGNAQSSRCKLPSLRREHLEQPILYDFRQSRRERERENAPNPSPTAPRRLSPPPFPQCPSSPPRVSLRRSSEW